MTLVSEKPSQDQLQKLQQQRIRLEQEKFRSNFWSFTVDLLGYTGLQEQPHREVVSYLLAPGNFKLVLLPRGSYKSTIITISYSLWRLTSNPNLRILIDGEDTDKTKKFLAAIKEHIEGTRQGSRFREVFGDWKSVPGWEKDQITLAVRTKVLPDPSIKIGGINAPVTGGHYDLIIADDLHDETNSQTEEQCRRVILHYATLFPILDPNGMMIVIGTRWSNWDLYGHILTNEKHVEF